MSLEEGWGKRKTMSEASSTASVSDFNPRIMAHFIHLGPFSKSITWLKLPLLSPQLPEVSAKAAEKGYSVGDLLHEVMKFAKERQLDEAVGNMAKKQLLDWLLTNLWANNSFDSSPLLP